MRAIQVMVVDDSAVVRQVLTSLLNAAPGIEVLHAVADPVLAIERLKQAWPDVIVLDVEMPRMDGITFLRKIMSERPTPVVICSTLTEKGAKTTLEAMSAGAVAIVTKPKLGLKQFLVDSSNDLVSTVKAAARANVRRLVARAEGAPPVSAAAISAPAASANVLRSIEILPSLCVSLVVKSAVRIRRRGPRAGPRRVGQPLSVRREVPLRPLAGVRVSAEHRAGLRAGLNAVNPDPTPTG